MRVRRYLPDAILVVLVFAAAAWWGAHFTRASLAAGREPSFYQSYFEPALMMACGRGFVLTLGGPPADVFAFLQQKSDHFSCAQLPADLRTTTNGVYQNAWFYLMSSVALTWRLVGISWSGLPPLLGALFGLSVVSVYGACRFGMGRVLATLCAAAVAISTVHLLNLPHLRDYSKAPFVLASIVVLAALVTRPPSWRSTPLLAALYGAVLGFGYGFRTDLLAGLPVLVVVLFLFLPGGVLKNIRVKLTAAAAFVATFLVCAWPAVNWVVTRGGCQWHVVLLGLTPSFDQELGVTTPGYQWGHTYSDSYIYAAVNAYTDRVAPEVGKLEFCWPEYDRMSGRYLRDVILAVPGDLLTRAYASTIQITDLPFRWYSQPLDGMAPWLYLLRAGVLRELIGCGWIPVVIALGIIGAANLRLGLFLLFFLVYFGGYPALQFQNRHYFHLEFITWWAIGFLLQCAFDLVRRKKRQPHDETVPSPSLRDWSVRLVTFAAIAAVLVLLPLWALRAYQHATMRNVIQVIAAAPRFPLPVTMDSDGVALVPPAPSRYQSPDPREMQYLDVELDPAVCGQDTVVSLRYAPDRPDLARVIPAIADARIARHVMAPAFWHFRGVEVRSAAAECLKSIARVDLPATVAAMPTLVLPDHWDTLRLHQEIRR